MHPPPPASSPYDSFVKFVLQGHPREVLRVFDGRDVDPSIPVINIDKEILRDPLKVDGLIQIGIDPVIEIRHFEAVTRWKGDEPERIIDYGYRLARAMKTRVRSTLIPLVEQYAPKVVPCRAVIPYGGGALRGGYRVQPFWMVDVARALAEHPDFVVLAPLMRHDAAQRAEFIRLAQRSRNPNYVVGVLMTGALRYGMSGWREILLREGLRMLTDDIEAMLLDSELGREILARSHARGADQGWTKGRLEGEENGVRNSLLEILSQRFPGIDGRPYIERIHSIDVLNSLLGPVMRAATAGEALGILRSAAGL